MSTALGIQWFVVLQKQSAATIVAMAMEQEQEQIRCNLRRKLRWRARHIRCVASGGLKCALATFVCGGMQPAWFVVSLASHQGLRAVAAAYSRKAQAIPCLQVTSSISFDGPQGPDHDCLQRKLHQTYAFASQDILNVLPCTLPPVDVTYRCYDHAAQQELHKC